MKALSTRNDDPLHASRPFDTDRDGFVMGEGAGVLVFEELEHARRRGARIFAEVKGFGSTCDAYHITAPDPDGSGPAKAMIQAVKKAGWKLDQVDLINAHGHIDKPQRHDGIGCDKSGFWRECRENPCTFNQVNDRPHPWCRRSSRDHCRYPGHLRKYRPPHGHLCQPGSGMPCECCCRRETGYQRGLKASGKQFWIRRP